METEKAYLNPELRQADVADALKCQVHELSQVLNVQLGQSFPDFVNCSLYLHIVFVLNIIN